MSAHHNHYLTESKCLSYDAKITGSSADQGGQLWYLTEFQVKLPTASTYYHMLFFVLIFFFLTLKGASRLGTDTTNLRDFWELSCVICSVNNTWTPSNPLKPSTITSYS